MKVGREVYGKIILKHCLLKLAYEWLYLGQLKAFTISQTKLLELLEYIYKVITHTNVEKQCNTHISYIYKIYLEFSEFTEGSTFRTLTLGKRLNPHGVHTVWEGRIIRTSGARNSLSGDRSPDDLGSPRASAALIRRKHFANEVHTVIKRCNYLNNNYTWLSIINNILGLQSVRFYSKSVHDLGLASQRNAAEGTLKSSGINANIKELLSERSPDSIKPFSGAKLYTCSNLLDLKEREKFFKQIKGKGSCIYIFTCKNDNKVFYIGRALDLRFRFNDHKKYKKKYDKFHVLARRWGWDRFTLSVIEFCNKKDLITRENYYITHYLPILNSQQKVSDSERLGLGCQVWVYNNETLNSIGETPFPSIKSAADYFQISTSRLAKHLDTNSCINIKGQGVNLFIHEWNEWM